MRYLGILPAHGYAAAAVVAHRVRQHAPQHAHGVDAVLCEQQVVPLCPVDLWRVPRGVGMSARRRARYQEVGVEGMYDELEDGDVVVDA